MKKTFLTCMAVLALFAIATSASAITCTVDTRPAATLLVPYFAVSLNADATVNRGEPTSVDTLLAIGNASSAPMIAHVSVYNKRSILVLDFNVALTGFDIQTWRMSDVISGILPSTPVGNDHTGPNTAIDPLDDVCQRNAVASVYPAADGFLRIAPPNNLTADPNDNKLATAAYTVPAFGATDAFGLLVVDSLDDTDDSRGCGDGTVDGETDGPAIGYVTIDHANYCTLSNPDDQSYHEFNALGGENNLFGDIIFTSGEGIGTYGMSMISIEQDPSLTGSTTLNTDLRTRTFYARYWSPFDTLIQTCQNCGSGLNRTDLSVSSPWNVLYGDQREPLGLRWAARYFEGPAVISFFDVWRASSGSLTDLADGGDCDTVEPTVQLGFFDEDENTVTQTGPGPCPSPCTVPPTPTVNFPYETNRVRVGGDNGFNLPAPPAPGGNQVGWVTMNFVNLAEGTELDQAWAAYEFDGSAAFVSAHIPGVQLDPSACEPLGIVGGTDVNPITPVIPGGVLGDGNPPAGIGPSFIPVS